MTRKYLVCFASLFILIATGVWSCNSSETPGEEAPAEAASVPEPVVEPASEPEAVEPSDTTPQATVAETPMPTAEPSAEQNWEQTVWVAGKEGKLVRGLDGGEYDPYAVSTVQQVQQALKSEGLYDGPVSGILDQATMQAIGEFQKSNNLQVCGVPTARTREALSQR
jgi:Putative peptidoglycan binding domain